MDAIKITVRPARIEDTTIIAKAVAMAIGDEKALQNYCGEEPIAVLEEIARRENTQYSWKYAFVAEVDGVAAGAIVGYDGALLKELRDGTFTVLQEYVGRVPHIPDETSKGEYYLDSIGILPEFRGMGIGRQLVATLCDRAFAEGHERVGLIVDFNNPQAERLYTSLGFERVGTREFFKHEMWHLQRHVSSRVI